MNKVLMLMLTGEEVERNFEIGQFECTGRENSYEDNDISIDLITIKSKETEFKFTVTTLLSKGNRKFYSELVEVK